MGLLLPQPSSPPPRKKKVDLGFFHHFVKKQPLALLGGGGWGPLFQGGHSSARGRRLRSWKKRWGGRRAGVRAK